MEEKRGGYRFEYASSGRSKCKGQIILFPPMFEISADDVLLNVLPLWLTSRSQTMQRYAYINCQFLYYFSHSSSGTLINKGELRFGTLVDMKGMTSL